MNHKIKRKSFGRKSGPRAALFRNLVSSLVEYERVKTTLPKAKELRRHVEKAVTQAKKGSVHARRNLLSKYPYPAVVSKLVDNLGSRFGKTPGGYTRIIKLGTRSGDNAEMAFIEFTDYDYEKPPKAFVAPTDKKIQKTHAQKKKRIRKTQIQSRRVNRK